MRKVREWEERSAARCRRGVCFLDLGNDSPPPPQPDPRIGEAAAVNAEVSKEMLDFAREQWQQQQQRLAEFDPLVKQYLDIQTRVARDSADRADEQWRIYRDEFRPVESRMVSEAMDWDSQAALDRAAQEAGAGVARSAAAARDQLERSLIARGINPSSGAYTSALANLGLGEMAARAGAENAARENRRLQGVQLRTGAAQFGRNMPQTGIAAGSLSLQGAGSGAQTANMQLMAPGAAAAQTLPWYSGAVGANTAGGNLMLGQYQGQLGAWNAQRQAEATEMAGLGQLAGTALGWYLKSSEDAKEDKKPVNTALILEGLEAIPVEAWKYKEGEGDGGRHIGPYAEDVQAQFGDAAAPAGEAIDLVTMNGIALAGIKELAKKVKNIERRIGLDAAEPSRNVSVRRAK
jgi:hypothetical protein